MIGSGLPLPGLGAGPAPGPAPLAGGGGPAPSNAGAPAADKTSGPGRAPARNARAAGEQDADAARFDRMLDEGTGEASSASASGTPATEPGPAAAPADDRSDASGDAAPATASAPALPDQMLAMFASLAPAANAPGAAASAADTAASVAGPGLPVPPTVPAAAMPAATAASVAGGLPIAPTGSPAQPASADPAGLGMVASEGVAFVLPEGADDRDAAPAPDTGGGFDLGALQAAAPAGPLAALRDPSPVPVAPMTVALAADPQAGLDDAFGGNLLWMADQKIGSAEIRVTPENMGPIDVRLHMDGTRVRAEFASAQPEVRQALESGMGRLRDMLGQHGLQLTQADVGQRQSQAQGSSPAAAGRDGDAAGDLDMPSTTPRPLLRSRGLLDEYA